MSNKRKNSDYNFKNRETIEKEKQAVKKEEAKSNKLYWLSTLLLWVDLIAVVGLAISKYNGSLPNSEKAFIPMTAVAMFLLAYKNKKFSKTFKIVVVIVGIAELIFGIYINIAK